MSRVDSPFDPGADSCLSKATTLATVFVVLPALLLRLVVRKARRR